MIYEYRTYTVAEGRIKELHDRFQKYTLEIFKRHNIMPIAFFIPDNKKNTQMQYIVAFESHKQREEAWNNFLADNEWKEIHKRSNENGALVVNIHSEILELTEYSPNL